MLLAGLQLQTVTFRLAVMEVGCMSRRRRSWTELCITSWIKAPTKRLTLRSSDFRFLSQIGPVGIQNITANAAECSAISSFFLQPVHWCLVPDYCMCSRIVEVAVLSRLWWRASCSTFKKRCTRRLFGHSEWHNNHPYYSCTICGSLVPFLSSWRCI